MGGAGLQRSVAEESCVQSVRAHEDRGSDQEKLLGQRFDRSSCNVESED